MLCKLCEKNKPLVRAYIVARCLIQSLNEGGFVSRYSNVLGELPARTPTGDYDTNILCAECDSYFSPWEDYTADLLYKQAPKVNVSTTKRIYTVPYYDYAALKLCFLSIAWRMSISKREAFHNVSLGPYEEQIRQMLLRKDPGTQKQIPIMVERFKDSVGRLVMFGPQAGKAEGLNRLTFGLPGYRVHLKVDRRPLKEGVLGYALALDKPLTVFLNRIDEGHLLKRVKEIFGKRTCISRICTQKTRALNAPFTVALESAS